MSIEIDGKLFTSVNHDRVYDSDEFSSIFSNIVNDGIFKSFEEGLEVVPNTGMSIKVGTGRAWFNNTWTVNDADYVLDIQQPDIAATRIDTVVLEVNKDDDYRINSLKVVTGEASLSPVPPELISTEDVHQYPLAYIKINPRVSSITKDDITDNRGTAECPFADGVLDDMDAEMLLAQIKATPSDWRTEARDEFLDWFNSLPHETHRIGKNYVDIDPVYLPVPTYPTPIPWQYTGVVQHQELYRFNLEEAGSYILSMYAYVAHPYQTTYYTEIIINGTSTTWVNYYTTTSLLSRPHKVITIPEGGAEVIVAVNMNHADAKIFFMDVMVEENTSGSSTAQPTEFEKFRSIIYPTNPDELMAEIIAIKNKYINATEPVNVLSYSNLIFSKDGKKFGDTITTAEAQMNYPWTPPSDDAEWDTHQDSALSPSVITNIHNGEIDDYLTFTYNSSGPNPDPTLTMAVNTTRSVIPLIRFRSAGTQVSSVTASLRYFTLRVGYFYVTERTKYLVTTGFYLDSSEYVNQYYPLIVTMDCPDYPSVRYGACKLEYDTATKPKDIVVNDDMVLDLSAVPGSDPILVRVLIEIPSLSPSYSSSSPSMTRKFNCALALYKASAFKNGDTISAYTTSMNTANIKYSTKEIRSKITDLTNDDSIHAVDIVDSLPSIKDSNTLYISKS